MLDVTSLVSASSVSAAVLVALLTYLSIPSVQQRAVRQLPAPFTGWFAELRSTIVVMQKHSPRIYDWLLDNCRDFQGKPWRMQVLGRPATIVVSSATVEHILKTQFESFVKGEYNSNVMFDVLGQGIIATDGELWAHQRRTVSHLFSLRMMRETMEDAVRSHCLTLDAKLTSIAASTEPVVNMKQLLDLFTMDVFTRIGFGIELKGLEEETRTTRSWTPFTAVRSPCSIVPATDVAMAAQEATQSRCREAAGDRYEADQWRC